MVVEEIENPPIQKFQAQVYSVNDFVGWHERNELLLSPSFQRRRVWSRQGKSYLIDSIIRGMPIPQIFIRQKIHPSARRTVREVVDGQQRISTILDYIDGKFTVLPSHNPKIARRKYAELPESMQLAILSYPFSVNVLSTSSDAEVLEIFARINSYSITLNRQERLNAQYTGAFKEAMHRLARRHLAYWSNHRILTSQRIARMADVDLVADLVATMMSELHDGKSHIESHYKEYDDEFPGEGVVSSQFNQILVLIEEIVGADIEKTEFRRVPLFYSLFTAIYDIVFGLGYEAEMPKKKLTTRRIASANASLQELSDVVAVRETGGKYGEFVRATTSSTDKLPQRRLRHDFLKALTQRAFS